MMFAISFHQIKKGRENKVNQVNLKGELEVRGHELAVRQGRVLMWSGLHFFFYLCETLPEVKKGSI